MRPEDLRELLRREPFLPFRLNLSDGNLYEVHDPQSVAVGKTHLFIVLPDDRWKWIPYRHIASVETLQAA
jgi:hypothetical protein